MRLHHVQVACPVGGEDASRRFYRDGLGLIEVPKPVDLQAMGGCWFRAFEDGVITAEVHVGLEERFVSARKAHPALLTRNVAELEETGDRLGSLGFEVDWSQRHTYPGFERFHTFDAYGNRVELLAPATPV